MLSTRSRSVTPNRRWRSARRRSNEKSATQIRRETPPFWRTKTGTVAMPEHETLITRVEQGWEVVVNGKPVTLPIVVTSEDHVTLSAAQSGLSIPVDRETGSVVGRAKSPPSWMKKGAKVDLFPVLESAPATSNPRVMHLGDVPTLVSRACLCDPFPVNAQWGILVDGHRGWVPIEQLRQSS